jgi:hypothetical protein
VVHAGLVPLPSNPHNPYREYALHPSAGLLALSNGEELVLATFGEELVFRDVGDGWAFSWCGEAWAPALAFLDDGVHLLAVGVDDRVGVRAVLVDTAARALVADVRVAWPQGTVFGLRREEMDRWIVHGALPPKKKWSARLTIVRDAGAPSLRLEEAPFSKRWV